jgi:hypothetical protein
MIDKCSQPSYTAVAKKTKMTSTCLSLQVIAAEGEQKASRALRQAADVIAESSSALQVQKSQKYIGKLLIQSAHIPFF